MSLQWMTISYGLYIEMFLCTIMLLPKIPAVRIMNEILIWFEDSFLLYRIKLLFVFILIILVVVFLDSFWDMHVFSDSLREAPASSNPATDTMLRIKAVQGSEGLLPDWIFALLVYSYWQTCFPFEGIGRLGIRRTGIRQHSTEEITFRVVTFSQEAALIMTCMIDGMQKAPFS